MKYALVNPNWTFKGSIYFGCREPHLALELGYSKAFLEQNGHEAIIIDGQLFDLSNEQIRHQVSDYQPDFTVVTTAPSYLFWRCAPPELRVPRECLDNLRDIGGKLVAVGPHGSTTPRTTLSKLGVDVVVLGECEEILPQLAQADWAQLKSICYRLDDQIKLQGTPHSTNLAEIPALKWPIEMVQRHGHYHHRFDTSNYGPGAEMETSRGCPYHCSFCAKENFRDGYRKRPLPIILEELDGLIAQGVVYVYFIDEIFLPNKLLLQALVERNVTFGVQTRIDLWNHELLELLGRAGCVSVEAGVESITAEGRKLLDKNCKLSTDELAERLIYAKQHIAFVQANLLESNVDDSKAIEVWRKYLMGFGVWSNKPVPLFPYPGSPDYTKKWGLPDDRAWERAHENYLSAFREFSDIQEEQPVSLPLLEINTYQPSHA